MEPARHGTTPEEHDALRVQALALPDEQRLLRVIAQRALLFWALDVLSVMRLAWDTLAMRGVWAGLMLALAWKLPSLAPRHQPLVRFVVVVLVPTLACGLITQRLGGTANPLFSTFALLPVLGLLLPWRQPWDGALRVVVPLLGALVVMGLEGTPAPRMATWLVVLLGAALVGANLGRYHQRLARAGRQQRQLGLVAAPDAPHEAAVLGRGRCLAGIAGDPLFQCPSYEWISCRRCAATSRDAASHRHRRERRSPARRRLRRGGGRAPGIARPPRQPQ